jgi:hypothetical protein
MVDRGSRAEDVRQACCALQGVIRKCGPHNCPETTLSSCSLRPALQMYTLIVYLPGLRNDRVAIAIALASANSVAAKSLLRRREDAFPKKCRREQSRRSAAVALSQSLLSSQGGFQPKSGLDDCYPRSFLDALEVSKHTNLGFYPLCDLHWLKSNSSRARTFPLSLVARAAYPPRFGREDALQQIGEVTSGSSTDDIALAISVIAGKRLSKR